LIGNILDVSTLYHDKATTSEIQKPKEKTLYSQHIKKKLVNSYNQPAESAESIGFKGSSINHSKYQHINDQNNYSEIISNRGTYVFSYCI